MSPLIVTWSMCASVSLMLGLMHLLFWLNYRKKSVYLLSSVMAFSAGISAILEMGMLFTQSLDTYRTLIRWENLVIFMILIPMVWFVQVYFTNSRRWLAITITLLWSAGLVINFLSPHSLTFYSIDELRRLPAFWGELFTVPSGTENPFKWLVDITSLLILIYVGDATIRSWQQGNRKKALVIGGGIITFILAAGIHTPLVDAGIIHTPYMISFAFLAIVITMSYQLVIEAMRATEYAHELQQARQNLDQLARSNLLGECSNMMAHELNQPLTAILSNAQAARRYLDSNTFKPEQIREILDDIVRDDKRASEIISRLRSMLQKEEVIRERFDLSAAVQEAVSMLSHEFKEKNIQLIECYSSEPTSVTAGRIELQQVMINLMVNAIKAMDKLPINGRRLDIDTSVIDGAVRVVVKDSGHGISRGLHESLFDSFVSGAKDGMGMGLAISHRIIETYGGRIWADHAKAGGAVFSFTLPLDKNNHA